MLFLPKYSQSGTIVPSNVPWPWQQSSVIAIVGAKLRAALEPMRASLGDVPISAPSLR